MRPGLNDGKGNDWWAFPDEERGMETVVRGM